MRVYYFVSHIYGLQDVVFRELKVSRISEVNDPFEWASPQSLQKINREKFIEYRNKMSEGLGFICFSDNWRNPLLWSHYADRHRGWCLAFDIEDSLLTKVDYVDQRIACNWEKFDFSKTNN